MSAILVIPVYLLPIHTKEGMDINWILHLLEINSTEDKLLFEGHKKQTDSYKNTHGLSERKILYPHQVQAGVPLVCPIPPPGDLSCQ